MKSHITNSSLNKGFTLVELMISVAVVGMVTFIAIPSYGRFIAANRLSAQANEMLSAITYSRSEAIRLNRNIMFCNTTDGATCNTTSGAWQQWLVLDPLSGVLRTSHILNSSLNVLSDTGMTNDTIVFTPMGLARNAANTRLPYNGIIRVCVVDSALDSNGRDVEISSGGRIMIERFLTNSGTCSKPEV